MLFLNVATLRNKRILDVKLDFRKLANVTSVSFYISYSLRTIFAFVCDREAK